MDEYQGQGDLADILMQCNRVPPNDDFQCAATSPEDHSAVNRRFPPQHDDCLPHGDGDRGYDFGDPFSNPLLHELELMSPNGSSFFGRSILEDSAIYPVEEKAGDFGDDCHAFSRDIAFSSTLYVPSIQSQFPQQDLSVSSNAVPFVSLENPTAYSEAINSNSRLRLVDTATAMQISAVQNSSMKRRGYYRCSSSNGCSARKQVERNRTNLNMLVITYTSEHNHPMLTQRNPLAGSTRITQSANKNNNGNNALPEISSSNSSPSKSQQRQDKRPNEVVSPGKAAAGGSSSAYIKKEMKFTNSETLEETGMTVLFPGKCDNEFLFQDMEAMDGGGDRLSFLLNQGVKQKSITVDSDSFCNFFVWLD